MTAVLAALIVDCDNRLRILDTDATQAAQDGSFRAARISQALALEVRRERAHLQGMQDRLTGRFFQSGHPAASAPTG